MANTAEKMRKKLQEMSEKLPRRETFGADRQRQIASEMQRRALDQERRYGFGSFDALGGDDLARLGLKSDPLMQEWARELALPSWHTLLDPRAALEHMELGLGAMIFHPYTSIAKSLAGWAMMLGLIPEPSEEDKKDHARNKNEAIRLLREAEDTWEKLVPLVKSLASPDELQKAIDEVEARVPEEARHCFRRIARNALAEYERDYRELVNYVRRLEDVRARLTKGTMLSMLTEKLALTPEEWERYREYTNMVDDAIKKKDEFELARLRHQVAKEKRYADVLTKQEAFERAMDLFSKVLPRDLSFAGIAEALENAALTDLSWREVASVFQSLALALGGLRRSPLAPDRRLD
jgi:tetratricopeptide (TPR) repeat protein